MSAGRPLSSKALTTLLALLMAFALPPASAHESDLPTISPDAALQEGGHGQDVPDDGFWNIVEGFSTKTGFRLVFIWDTDQPIAAEVRWGFNEALLDQIVLPLGDTVDTAGLAVNDIDPSMVDPDATVYFEVRDASGLNPTSPIKSFPLGNAWTSEVESDGIYEVDALMMIDSEATPVDQAPDLSLEEVANAVDIMAERVWDMTDGYVRLGKVVVADSLLSYPELPAPVVCQPLPVPVVGSCAGTALPCTADGTTTTAEQETPVGDAHTEHTVADYVITTTTPVASHTFLLAIENPCIGFYIGRLAWHGPALWQNDLQMGYVMTHEFGHYALGLMDLYDAGGNCQVGTLGPPGGANYDISVMHNAGGWNGVRWTQTELDRRSTPCPRNDPGSVSWPLFVNNYPEVPARGRFGDDRPDHKDAWTDPSTGTVHNGAYDAPRGNPDGGALDVFILDHETGVSKIRHYIQAPPGGPNAPPLPPIGVTSVPAVLIDTPKEGARITTPTATFAGVVDRLFEIPQLRVDAFGPYFGDNDTEIQLRALVSGGADPPGDYLCEWSSANDAVFEGELEGEEPPADPCTGIKVTFDTPGLKMVRLDVFDNATKVTTGFDTALVNVLLPLPDPTGCGDLMGIRVTPTDSESAGDVAVPPTIGATAVGAAADLFCVGADWSGTDFTFQVEVVNKASTPVGSSTSAPPALMYDVRFTPDFGTFAGQAQAIQATWTNMGSPTACWVATPVTSDVCDTARSPPQASWDGNTLLLKFGMGTFGTPAEDSRFNGVYANSWHLEPQPLVPARFNDDYAPDARNGVIIFHANQTLSTIASSTVCVDDGTAGQTELEVLGYDLLRLCATQDNTYLTLTATVDDLVIDETLQGTDTTVSYSFFINKDPVNTISSVQHYAVTHANTPAAQIWAFPSNVQVPNSPAGNFYATYDYGTERVTLRVRLSALPPLPPGVTEHRVAVTTQVGEGPLLTGGLRDNADALGGTNTGIPYQDAIPATGLIIVPAPNAAPPPAPSGFGPSGGFGGGPGSGFGSSPQYLGPGGTPEGTDPCCDDGIGLGGGLGVYEGANPAMDIRAVWIERETEFNFDVVVKVENMLVGLDSLTVPTPPHPPFCCSFGVGVAFSYEISFNMNNAGGTVNYRISAHQKPEEISPEPDWNGGCLGATNIISDNAGYVEAVVWNVDSSTVRFTLVKDAIDLSACIAHSGDGIVDGDVLQNLCARSIYEINMQDAALLPTADDMDCFSSRPYTFGRYALEAVTNGPYEGEPGEPILIEGSARYPVGPYNCIWAGALAEFEILSPNDCLQTVNYTLPGVYPLQLTVLDSAGQVAINQTLVKVGVDGLPEFVIVLLDDKPVGLPILVETSLASPVDTWSIEKQFTDKDNGFHRLEVIWFEDFGLIEVDRAVMNFTVLLPQLSASKSPVPLDETSASTNSAVAGLDSDGDGAKDGVDNCVFTANAGQEDLDADGVGDVCDLDLDGDGWDNVRDNCVDVADAEQLDTDGDRLGDACDADDDDDLVADKDDNCRVVGNALQVDLDLDGLGDACDGDDDNDGVLDLFDAFARDSSEWSDFDGDGVGDEEDADDDGDGIGDGEESVRDRFNAASSLGADERDASALDAPSRDTPALGAWAVLAALAVALLLARRRA